MSGLRDPSLAAGDEGAGSGQVDSNDDEAPVRQVALLEIDGRQVRLWELPFTIGRASDCSLTIDEPHLSRRHCSIEVSPDGFYIVSHSQTNPTCVNGAAVESAGLEDGDSIELGGRRLGFASYLTAEPLDGGSTPPERFAWTAASDGGDAPAPHSSRTVETARLRAFFGRRPEPGGRVECRPLR